MSHPSGLDRIINRVQVIADAPGIAITPETPLLSSGLIDSLSMNELAVCLEQEFGVAMDVADLGFDNADTPAQLLALVESRS